MGLSSEGKELTPDKARDSFLALGEIMKEREIDDEEK